MARCYALVAAAAATLVLHTDAQIVISTSRYVIDRWNLTFNLHSDEMTSVSAGSSDFYGDNIGTARSTAVMFHTPVGNGLPYTPVRCDILLYKLGGQTRNNIKDFFITLYSDDGSEVGNPGVQLSAPFSLVNYGAALLTFRAIWYQITIAANWPKLSPDTSYWVALSPGAPVTLSTTYPFDGPVWAAIDIDSEPIPADAGPTSALFTGRELNSQRFTGDTVFGGNTRAGVNFVRNSTNWARQGSRFVNFWKPDGTGSSHRYGLQVLGNQASPTPSSTRSRTNSATSSVTRSATKSRTITASSSLTRSATASRTNTASTSRSKTNTASPSFTRSAASTRTSTRSASVTKTFTALATKTASASLTRSSTSTRSSTASASLTRSSTSSHTATATASLTKTSISTSTAASTASSTSSRTATSTSSKTRSAASTSSSTRTSTASHTASKTPSPTASTSPTPTPSATPRPTTISGTRYTIDKFELTSARATDVASGRVAIGADAGFGDAGTLVSQAVLIKSCDNPPGYPTLVYRPSRIDVLLFVKDGAYTRNPSDFFVTLYSDDGSAAHNPLWQLAAPYKMTGRTAPLQATRGTWYQHDITAAGWPIMKPSTYYWIVLTPSTPLALTTQASGKYNGALWSGILDTTAPLNAATLADPHVFKARRLTSERFKNDALFQASTNAGVNVLKNATNWGASGIDQRRVTSYGASNVRYGIQLLGWQVQPAA